MFKKVLIALGLLGVSGLAGCVVVEPRHHYYRSDSCVSYYEPAPVVVAPVFGFYGGYGYHGYYGYHEGYRHRR